MKGIDAQPAGQLLDPAGIALMERRLVGLRTLPV
jgi:hypothetical protein